MDGPDSFTYYPASGSQKPSKRGRRTYETGSSEVGRPTSVQPCVTNNTRRRRNTKLLGGLPTASTSYGLSAMPFVLPAPVKCYHCQARKFAYESLHFCCGNGTIKLASNEYPLILSRLFTSKDEDAVHFRQYARAYNNMFAYTSIGGKIESRTEKGIYVFKLYGQVYHYLPTLLPENSQPKYLQLYFYDGQHESENRANCFPELREAVIDVLIEVTRENPYAIFFRSLRELNVSTDTQIIINKNTVLDQRTYNAPQTNEVAVIWPESTASSYTSSPHIVVSGKDNASHRVMHYYGCYDPLQYPLLFPYGDCGWTQGLLKVNKEQHMGTSSDVLPGPNSRAAHEDSDWVQHMVQVDAEQHQATSSNVGVNPAPQTVQELLQKEAALFADCPTMKPGHVYLNELKPTSKDYKVKVKVIEKSRPKTSPKKGIVYQSLMLEDEKGNKMRGALFGDQVESFKDALVYNGVYEVANAPIKPCPDQWKTNSEEMDYQMSFGKQTIVQQADSQTSVVGPEYCSIGQIPRSGNPSDRFDIVAVVLFIEQEKRTVTTKFNRESFVREIVVIDHSCSQPLTISLWSDLAESVDTVLGPAVSNFSVVGFTALKPSNYKGFSLSTTMSSSINTTPDGERALALTNWVRQHSAELISTQRRVIAVRDPSQPLTVLTVQALKDQKIEDTLQDERHRLRVFIVDADFTKINAYLGCSNCAAHCDVPGGHVYNCENCLTNDCISTPRVTFTCEVTDGTGTLPLTIFTTDCERLFKMNAPDIFKMQHSADMGAFEALQKRMASEPFLVEVGPKTSLTTSNVLQWALKRIIDVKVTDKPPSTSTGGSPLDDAPTTTKSEEGITESVQSDVAVTYKPPSTSTGDSPLDDAPTTTKSEEGATESVQSEPASDKFIA